PNQIHQNPAAIAPFLATAIHSTTDLLTHHHRRRLPPPLQCPTVTPPLAHPLPPRRPPPAVASPPCSPTSTSPSLPLNPPIHAATAPLFSPLSIALAPPQQPPHLCQDSDTRCPPLTLVRAAPVLRLRARLCAARSPSSGVAGAVVLTCQADLLRVAGGICNRDGVVPCSSLHSSRRRSPASPTPCVGLAPPPRLCIALHRAAPPSADPNADISRTPPRCRQGGGGGCLRSPCDDGNAARPR
ncbi:Os10g0322300, partial [Oryza sativa Japonica Group]